MKFEDIQRAFVFSSLVMALGTFCAIQFTTTATIEFTFDSFLGILKVIAILSIAYGVVYFSIGSVFVWIAKDTFFDNWIYYLVSGALVGVVVHWTLGFLPNPDGGTTPIDREIFMREVFCTLGGISGLMFWCFIRLQSNKTK